MARPPIYDRPMTPAERKARSRTMQLGTVVGYLEQAEQLAHRWYSDRVHAHHAAVQSGTDSTINDELADAFAELRLLIQNARNALPNG